MFKRIYYYWYFKKYNIPHRKEIVYLSNRVLGNIFTYKEIDIIHLYKTGSSTLYIADRFGCTRERVRQTLCKVRGKARKYIGRRWL